MLVHKIIDPHMHLWDTERSSYPWLLQEPGLPQPYLLKDYLAETEQIHIEKAVHIQAGIARELSVQETAWISELSHTSNFPLAIVGYVDLSKNTAEQTLAEHLQYPEFTGIRLILSDEIDYLSMPSFQHNLQLLSKYKLSFDLQIHPEQMPLAHKVFSQVTCTTVLNHLGLPKIFDKQYHQYWHKLIQPLAQLPHLRVKLSGLSMFNPHWTVDEVLPFIDSALTLFDSSRCMFASNFPVDKPSVSLNQLYDRYLRMVAQLNLTEQEASQLFYETADSVYF